MDREFSPDGTPVIKLNRSQQSRLKFDWPEIQRQLQELVKVYNVVLIQPWGRSARYSKSFEFYYSSTLCYIHHFSYLILNLTKKVFVHSKNV